MLVSPCLVLSLLSLLSQVQAGDRVEHPRSLIYLFGNILQWPERMEPKVEEKRVEQPSCEFLITKWTKWSRCRKKCKQEDTNRRANTDFTFVARTPGFSSHCLV